MTTPRKKLPVMGSAPDVRSGRVLDGGGLSATQVDAGVADGRSLETILRDVKLSVPKVRDSSVSRAPLTDAARDSQVTVVAVTAAAGYGKSTLLAEWAHRERRGVGWITFDALDDDPATLLFLLATGYERAVPERSGVAAAMSGLASSEAAKYLSAVLQDTPLPFVLLLDDLQEICLPATLDALGVVLSAIPPGSQAVTASRNEQPHLSRLRAEGNVVQLTASNLALAAPAVAQIFAAAGVPATPEQVLDVAERTEGWIVGAQLAALIAGDGGQGVDGDDHYIADYLRREVYDRFDPRHQRFLRRAAVLDRLQGSLCRAVLGEPEAENILQVLGGSNSFLIQLDRRREWYRWHPLFREFLLGELRRSDQHMIEGLHLRAANWLESHGAPATAVDHLLATQEHDRCARLVSRLGGAAWGDGRVSMVQRWLTALGDPAVEADPALSVLAGWVAACAGRPIDATHWVEVADEASSEMMPTDEAASFISSRSLLRAMMCASGAEQMMADAELAVAAARPRSPWRGAALCALADAHLLAGTRTCAKAALEDATAAGVQGGDAGTVALSETGLGLLAMDDGRWDEAGGHVRLALDMVEEHDLESCAVSLGAFAAAARVALHDGDRVEADRLLERAMLARSAATYALPCLAASGRLQAAKVLWARGDHVSARCLQREMEDILQRRPALGTLAVQAAEFAGMTSLEGPGPTPRQVPLTPAELRVLPYLQTHLRLADVAQSLHVSRNTVASEVSAIYRKLGASSRGEAVQVAVVLGLLSG